MFCPSWKHQILISILVEQVSEHGAYAVLLQTDVDDVEHPIVNF